MIPLFRLLPHTTVSETGRAYLKTDTHTGTNTVVLKNHMCLLSVFVFVFLMKLIVYTD